jgi:hypothetical protein
MKELVSLSVLVGLCNTAPHVNIYVMESNVFLGYPEKGNALSLGPFRHEHCFFNISLDQNNLAHDVYNVM